ncbi:MAG: Bcr/CflA family drug resistance efflux transporter, partial [Mesorhizobium sp.]
AMGVAGLFFDGTPLPMVAGITLCAVISFMLAKLTLGRAREAVEAPAE